MTPGRNPLFTGRRADLKQIAAALRAGRAVVLTGADGLGKTQLAVEFAHRFGRYFAGGVFWVSFGIPEEVSLQVAACGGQGGMELRADFSELALDDQLHLVLRSWQTDTPRLLVYDDCDNQDLLREWLPSSGGAHVLVTSRRASWDPALGLATLPLSPLPVEESVALLHRLRPDLPEAGFGLRDLAEELEDLPLALRLAGGFLRRYRDQIGLDTLLEQLRSREVGEQAATLAADGEAPGPGAGQAAARGRLGRRRSHQPPAAARTFVLLDRWLERADPAGRAALALLARAAWFAPGEPVPRQVLLEAGGGPGAETGLRRLTDLGLLEADEGMLRLHRLTADCLRGSGADLAALVAVEDATIAWARAVNDGDRTDQRMLAAPHLDVVVRAALGRAEDERAAGLSFEFGRLLWAAGDLRRARMHMERALEIRQRVLGPDDHRTITSLSGLGSLLQAQGDLAGAQSALELALAKAQATLGTDHPDTAVILTNLAWTLRFQGDLAGARGLLERALAVSERTLGPDHFDTVACLDGLGMLLREQGDLPSARVHWERAMFVLEAALGSEHPRTLAAINNVGLLLREQGELALARQYLEHALTVSEETLGPDHPDTAAALDNMGTLLQAEGDLEGARRHIERALAIRERTLGSDNPATGTSYTNLGMLLRELGNLEGARPHLEQALIVSQRILGPYDPQTAASYNNLGTLLLQLGDLYGAQPHLERALAIREQGLGADHPETATSLSNVAALHVAYGDLHGARAYVERALEIREEVLGREHPLTAASSHELGRLLRGLGDLEGARRRYEQAVAIRVNVLGPDHPDTLASMNDLDHLVRDLGGGRVAWPKHPLPDSPYFESTPES